MLCDTLGITESDAFRKALRSAQEGREVPVVTLLRALGLEIWLRTILSREKRLDVLVSGSCVREAMEQLLS
jgi:hypothetical protein